MSKEQAQSDQLLARMQKNADAVKLGKVSKDFKGLPEMAKDPTSPLAPVQSTSQVGVSGGTSSPAPPAYTQGNVSSIASAITGQVPTAASTSTKVVVVQKREDIQRMAITAAAMIGVTVEEIHVEDLRSIVAAEGIPLTDREIRMYMRGVAKTNQISVTTTMAKLIGGVETLLAKNQKTMQTTADSNKSLLEKMNLVSTKLDSITPVICSTISSEAAEIKRSVTETVGSISQYIGKQPVEIVKTDTPASPEPPTAPTGEDIKKMCVMMGCPPHIIQFAVSRLVGLVTWEQHRMVLSGAISGGQFREMMEIWKSML